ncbi:STAS domain-containing protein [bacterium]|nr:STAS domain-containing protein [bacterium]
MKSIYVKALRQGRSLEISLIGELDQRVARRLLCRLERYIEQGVRVIRIDLRGVSFLDSAGVKALLCCMRCLRTLGGRLLLTRPSLAVRKIFSALGLESFLVSTAA